MRLVLAAVAVCAAILSTFAPLAAATEPLHPVGHVGPHAGLQRLGLPGSGGQGMFRYEPLARGILSGSGTISLNAYSYLGLAEVGARVDWLVEDGSDYGSGFGFTDADGHVELAGVPAATHDNGELVVSIDNSEHTLYALSGLSWGDSGWMGGLQPGLMPISLWRSSDKNWNGWRTARVRIWSTLGPQTHLAQTDFVGSDGVIAGGARTITTGTETLSGGTVHFSDDEGAELGVAGRVVSPGMSYGTEIQVLESNAQRVWMDYWGSGKPGTRTWLIMNNYGSGWTNSVTGIADWPETAVSRSFGTSTSVGDKYTVQPITIPTSTAAGYKYWVMVEHTDGPLSLVTSFQTCTLKPSKSTVAKGRTVSLTGVVPVKGHLGSTRGTPKYVTLYKTTSARTAKSQPARVGGKTVKGWTKVGRVRSDGLGKYRLSTRPGKTAWYCAWYAGDSWYWGAWTSVAKVAVR